MPRARTGTAAPGSRLGHESYLQSMCAWIAAGSHRGPTTDVVSTSHGRWSPMTPQVACTRGRVSRFFPVSGPASSRPSGAGTREARSTRPRPAAPPAVARARRPRSRPNGGRRRRRRRPPARATAPRVDPAPRRRPHEPGPHAEPPRRSTVASGCAWRLSHQAGSALAPAVHREGHQVRAVLVVAEDRDALLAGAAPDGPEPERAPLVGLRAPQADAAAGDRVDARGGLPRTTRMNQRGGSRGGAGALRSPTACLWPVRRPSSLAPFRSPAILGHESWRDKCQTTRVVGCRTALAAGPRVGATGPRTGPNAGDGGQRSRQAPVAPASPRVPDLEHMRGADDRLTPGRAGSSPRGAAPRGRSPSSSTRSSAHRGATGYLAGGHPARVRAARWPPRHRRGDGWSTDGRQTDAPRRSCAGTSRHTSHPGAWSSGRPSRRTVTAPRRPSVACMRHAVSSSPRSSGCPHRPPVSWRGTWHRRAGSRCATSTPGATGAPAATSPSTRSPTPSPPSPSGRARPRTRQSRRLPDALREPPRGRVVVTDADLPRIAGRLGLVSSVPGSIAAAIRERHGVARRGQRQRPPVETVPVAGRRPARPRIVARYMCDSSLICQRLALVPMRARALGEFSVRMRPVLCVGSTLRPLLLLRLDRA